MWGDWENKWAEHEPESFYKFGPRDTEHDNLWEIINGFTAEEDVWKRQLLLRLLDEIRDYETILRKLNRAGEGAHKAIEEDEIDPWTPNPHDKKLVDFLENVYDALSMERDADWKDELIDSWHGGKRSEILTSYRERLIGDSEEDEDGRGWSV